MTRLRVLLAGLIAALAVLAPAGAAQAHDALSRSNPKDKSEIAQAPEEVTLTYTAAVLKLGSTVRVIGPDGTNVAEGTPSFRDNEVTQPLRADLPAGDYRIDWQVTSSDGHPIAGKLAFTVTEGAAAPTPAPTAEPSETAQAPPTTTAPPTEVSPAADTEDEGSSWGGPAVFVLVAVVLVVVVVGAALLARNRTP